MYHRDAIKPHRGVHQVMYDRDAIKPHREEYTK